MALGIVGAYGGLSKKEVSDCFFVGELSLDGGIRGVRGALPIAIEARGRKISRLVVPRSQREGIRHGRRRRRLPRALTPRRDSLRELRQRHRPRQS
ncbi:MAG TPA: magnesium chelatase domain-containing protein [Candidatus Sulfotelmatobacter sp.]